MPKPFAKLRYAMEEADVDRADIAAKIGHNVSYVNQRFRCEYAWRLDEIYDILEMLNISSMLMSEYFPREKVRK